MWSKVLKDWTEVGGGLGTLLQSELAWFPTDLFQDAGFFVEVRAVTGTSVYLSFETSPTRDNSLFLPMQPELDLGALVASNTVQTCLAHATSGPPLASFVRWKLRSTAAAWNACFRVTMFSI